jgi:hypothetical protein
VGQPRVDDLRDKAMLALLSLQVVRTVEIWRSNVEDVTRRDEQWALLVRVKGHDRLIFLRGDVGEAVQHYLEHRGPVSPDVRGVPLFTAVGNRAGGERLSRRGLRKIVDGYLSQLGLKRPGYRTMPCATPAPPSPTSTPTICAPFRTCSAAPTRAPPLAMPASSTRPSTTRPQRCRSACDEAKMFWPRCNQ